MDVSQAWLEVDLLAPVEIARAMIDEAYGERTRRFELQYKEGAEWKTFFTGTTIGILRQLEFEPITAQHIRLHILEATAGPTFTEFELYGPKKNNR